MGSHPVPQGPVLPCKVSSCPFRSHPVPQGPVLPCRVSSCLVGSHPVLQSPILLCRVLPHHIGTDPDPLGPIPSHQVPCSPAGSNAALEGPILPRGAAGAGGGSRRQGSSGDRHSVCAKWRSRELKIPVGALPTEVEVSAPAARGWGGHARVSWTPLGTLPPSNWDPTKAGGSSGCWDPTRQSRAPPKHQAGRASPAPIPRWGHPARRAPTPAAR